MRVVALLAGAAVLSVVTVRPLQAQGAAATAPVSRTSVISASPLLMMFKWFNVDYERRISPAVTLGASGSYLPIDRGPDYQRATFHARYYPKGAALTGFYMGVQTGVHRTGSVRDRGVLVGAGMDLGYAWLTGPKNNYSVSIGFGTTRIFAGDHGGYALTIPNVRLLNIGIVF